MYIIVNNFKKYDDVYDTNVYTTTSLKNAVLLVEEHILIDQNYTRKKHFCGPTEARSLFGGNTFYQRWENDSDKRVNVTIYFKSLIDLNNHNMRINIKKIKDKLK